MRFLNFGSLNRDLVYSVPHAVLPGETLSSAKLEEFSGGKGLNQSLALARAGAEVYHAGCIGVDGGGLRNILEQSGVNTDYVRLADCPSGHAVIQLDEKGQNSIVLFGGANQQITREQIDAVLGAFTAEDCLILQNEINEISYLIEAAAQRGMRIIFNPSPFPTEWQSWPLDKVTHFVVNEIEGAQLSGKENSEDILDAMRVLFPNACTLLTLGAEGSVYDDGNDRYHTACVSVPVVDTTAAGDTFLGFFFAHLDTAGPQEALMIASTAAGMAVSVKGAANSIPLLADVNAFMKGRLTKKRLDILLDTDIGGDCDDMMALAYLVYAARYRGARIRSITHSQGCANGTALIRTTLRHWNEPVPPLGTAVSPTRTYDYYCSRVLERFAVSQDYADDADAVSVMRQALVDSNRAVLCAIGPMRNIAALLESGGDEISPLDGKTLVKEKCKKLVLMAGDFREGADNEWNVLVDAAAAQIVVKTCPVPIYFLPFDTGLNMYTGRELVKRYGDSTPLTLSFRIYPQIDLEKGRHSWDPASVLYAVEGCGERFAESEPGTVSVDDTGKTTITYHKDGLHRLLWIKEQDGCTEQARKEAIAAYIDACVETLYAEE